MANPLKTEKSEGALWGKSSWKNVWVIFKYLLFIGEGSWSVWQVCIANMFVSENFTQSKEVLSVRFYFEFGIFNNCSISFWTCNMAS